MQITPEQWSRVKDLYESALECEPSDRYDFLQRNTADSLVLQEARRLLEEHEKPSSFPPTSPHSGLPAEAKEQYRFQIGEVLAERFRIVRFIAAGGMGEVYEAEDLALEERVAIKTIRPEVLQQRNALERFKGEVHLARRVTHPNISRIFDLFWHKRADASGDDVVFVSMELLQGETLAERIHRAGRFTPEESLPIIKQIASGLEAAHRAGIVHRDLKPGNVILVPDGDQAHMRAVITDFGLAFRTGIDTTQRLNVTETCGILGTPAYMAPEQIEGKQVTKQTDIYALGLIIHEMVTGQHAFPADTPLASVVKRLGSERVSAKRILPDLSDTWEQTIACCLEREPNARFSSAEEVAEALSKPQTSSTTYLKRKEPRNLVSEPSTSWWKIVLATLGIAFSVSAGVWLAGKIWFHHPEPPLTAVPITSGQGMAGFPSLSPDGQQVAYSWDQNQGQNQGLPPLNIFVQSVEGSAQPLQLTHFHPPNHLSASAYWSPDGKWIAYERFNPVVGEKPVEIVLIPAPLGGHELVLQRVDDYCCFTMSWSPDSRYLAYQDHDGPEESSGIFLLDRNTLQRRRLTTPPRAGSNAGDSSPAFSRDGKRLAFVRSGSVGVNQVIVLTLASGAVHVIVTEFSTDAQVALVWDPNDQNLIYVSDRAGIKRLWRVPAKGGDPEPLTVGEDAWSLAISERAHRLAFAKGNFDINIWRIQLNQDGGETRAPLIASNRVDQQPVLSPDESKIAFASNRSGFDEIWASNSDGSDPVQLTAFGRHKTGTPHWSPDGRQVAFDSRVSGHADVYVVGLDGAAPRRLTNNGFENADPTWSPDGNWIYFFSNRAGDQQVWKIPSHGGEPLQVTEHGGEFPVPSPDGKILYYIKSRTNQDKYGNSTELWQKVLPSGDERRVPGIQDISFIMNFQITRDGVYFCDGDSLKYFSFLTRQTRTVTKLGSSLGFGISVSRDGHTILYSQVDNTSSNIMLVENFH